MINLPEIPVFKMDAFPVNYAISLFTLSTISIILGFHIIKSGIKNLIHRMPNMDTLVTLGVIASYFYSFYGTIQILDKSNLSFVHNLYFDSVTMVIFFIEIGKYIEGKNKNKTKEAIRKLVTITPKSATIIKDDDEKEVTIDEIVIGDIVVCKPGEKIAVDGEVVSRYNTHR